MPASENLYISRTAAKQAMVRVGFDISPFPRGVVEIALAADPACENQAAHHRLEFIDREEGDYPRIERVSGSAFALRQLV